MSMNAPERAAILARAKALPFHVLRRADLTPVIAALEAAEAELAGVTAALRELYEASEAFPSVSAVPEYSNPRIGISYPISNGEIADMVKARAVAAEALAGTVAPPPSPATPLAVPMCRGPMGHNGTGGPGGACGAGPCRLQGEEKQT